MRFTGTTVIITGAAGGLGPVISAAFAASRCVGLRKPCPLAPPS